MRVKVGAIGEMAAEFRRLERQGSHLVAIMEVPGAMPYEIVGSVNHKELMRIVRSALKPSIVSFLLFGFGGSKEPEPSDEEDW